MPRTAGGNSCGFAADCIGKWLRGTGLVREVSRSFLRYLHGSLKFEKNLSAYRYRDTDENIRREYIAYTQRARIPLATARLAITFRIIENNIGLPRASAR